MLITRAEDGESFNGNPSALDIDQLVNLKGFLNRLTGVSEDAIISFTEDGTQLRNDNVRELLGGVEEVSVFVYNRDYLDDPLEQVVNELSVEPQLQPPVEADTSRTNRQLIISAYARAAHFHYQHIVHRHATLHSQSTALRIASSNLDSHVLSLRDAFESFEAIANRELEKQAEILRGHTVDMDIISRVKVHTEFLSANVRRAVEMGGKERHLGDYVSHHKMQMVAESCAKLHDDLLTRFRNSQARMADLISGADRVRASVANPFIDEADACVVRAKNMSDRITAAGYDASLEEIARLDADLREEVRVMADIKNQSMVHSVQVLRDVSQLQSDLSNLPPVLSSLDVDLRVKAGFPHLSRLHNMLYVYGATIVEIVRRKEFSRLFMERAQTIAEMMAKLTANERKRRQVYRSEVHGQLPFEARGMDDPAPSLEINTSGSREPSFTLSRDDLIQFLELVEEIEKSTPISAEWSNSDTLHPIREVLVSLDKLISRIDGLEADFDKLAEKSILSASWLANSNKKRSTLMTKESSSSAYREALDLLQEKSDQERALREDREAVELQLSQLREELSKASLEKESMEEELQALRDQVASETAARRSLEQRHSDALVDVVGQARQLESALADATEKTKEVEVMKVELESSKKELEEVREAHLDSDQRIRTLLEEQAETLRNAEESRLHGEQNLKVQIEAARLEGEQAARALLDKERTFRSKAVERDRLLRDQIAEADGDRAVLEHQFAELRNQLDEKARELEEAKVETTGVKADGEKLAEEVRKASKEMDVLKEGKNAAEMRVLREREVVQRLERQLESSKMVMQEIMAVALAIRETNLKVMSSAQSFVTSSRNVADSVYSPVVGSNGGHTFARSPLSTEFKDLYTSPSAFRSDHTDPLDPEMVLDILKQFDLEAFVDSINKTGSTIRKWQKQCKEYRERAKSKITFRNFAKGDLALFLPTRNSFAKPWAAFNVSFPHYFLKAEGQLAEQLKTREWVVARIISISERVADHQDPDSNPYGLGDGVKFFMLEVEDWNQPAPAQHSSSGNRKRVLSTSNSSHRIRKESNRPAMWTTQQQRIGELSTSPETLSQPPFADGSGRPPSPAHRFLATTNTNVRQNSGSGPTSLGVVSGGSSTQLSKIAVAGSSGARSEPLTAVASTSASGIPASPSTISRPSSDAGHHHNLPSSNNPPSSPRRSRAGSLKSSASSRPSSVFAANRIPLGSSPGASSSNGAGGTKAAPTIAMSSDVPDTSPPGNLVEKSRERAISLVTGPESRIMGRDTPSPADSASEGMSTVLLDASRRRAVSNVGGAGNILGAALPSSAWTNFTSAWGATLTGKRKLKLAAPPPLVGEDEDEDRIGSHAKAAQDLLRRYDVGSGPSA